MATRKIKLSFKDSKENSKMLTIDYPKADVQDTEINTAMDKIIEANVLKTKDGLVTTKYKAYEETIEKTDYNLN